MQRQEYEFYLQQTSVETIRMDLSIEASRETRFTQASRYLAQASTTRNA